MNLEEINKSYDEIMNVSYLSSFLTSRSQKISNYKTLIEKYEEYLKTSENVTNENLESIYLKLSELYLLIDDRENALKYKNKYLNLLSDEQLKEKLIICTEQQISELLVYADESLKIKLYKYLITLNKKYLDPFICEFYNKEKEFLEPYVKELFEGLLGTPEAQKYGKLLDLDYVINTDPLPSNVDYYLSLKNNENK